MEVQVDRDHRAAFYKISEDYQKAVEAGELPAELSYTTGELLRTAKDYLRLHYMGEVILSLGDIEHMSAMKSALVRQRKALEWRKGISGGGG